MPRLLPHPTKKPTKTIRTKPSRRAGAPHFFDDIFFITFFRLLHQNINKKLQVMYSLGVFLWSILAGLMGADVTRVRAAARRRGLPLLMPSLSEGCHSARPRPPSSTSSSTSLASSMCLLHRVLRLLLTLSVYRQRWLSIGVLRLLHPSAGGCPGTCMLGRSFCFRVLGGLFFC